MADAGDVLPRMLPPDEVEEGQHTPLNLGRQLIGRADGAVEVPVAALHLGHGQAVVGGVDLVEQRGFDQRRRRWVLGAQNGGRLRRALHGAVVDGDDGARGQVTAGGGGLGSS